MRLFGAWLQISLICFWFSSAGCSRQEGAVASPGAGSQSDVRQQGAVRQAMPGDQNRVSDGGVGNSAELTSANPSDQQLLAVQDPAAQPLAAGDIAQVSAATVLPAETITGEPEAVPRLGETPASITIPPTRIDGADEATAIKPLKTPAETTDVAVRRSTDLAHEQLFVDWPQPAVTLVLTGRQYGYMEPCGCSGLENQNGGLSRRATLIRQLSAKGWPVIPIDAGNQVRRFGRQAEIKYQITIEGLRTMGYQVISFGPDDLRLPAPELVVLVAPSDDQPSLFVSANVEIYDASFTSPFRILERGGKKIGVTAVLGERNQKLINNDEIVLRSADAGLKAVWPLMEREKCDLYVLIAHATREESIALAQRYPQFQLVVTTGGAGEPMRELEKIEGSPSQMVEVATKGMFASVIGVFDDPTAPIRYQRVPLDSRFPDSQDMLRLLANYQDQLKAAGFEGLGIHPQPVASGLEFAGSESCKKCHEEEYKIWKDGLNGEVSKHAHAYATLQQPPNSRGGIPRNFDPECISCHVVGWNPQKYFPYKSGFLSLERTPQLTDVGCENCHGPGSRHNAAEDGDVQVSQEELETLRDQMWLDLQDAEQKCLECHDLDNSPAFQEKGAFERYWEKIEH